MSKQSPFDFVKSVYNSKEYLIDSRELFRKSYNSFIVNRALSNSDVGILFANEMNKYQLDGDIQYDFYFYGIPKQRGWLKWTKKEAITNESDIELIQNLYSVSVERAIEYLQLINKSDLEELRKLQGGK